MPCLQRSHRETKHLWEGELCAHINSGTLGRTSVLPAKKVKVIRISSANHSKPSWKRNHFGSRIRALNETVYFDVWLFRFGAHFLFCLSLVKIIIYQHYRGKHLLMVYKELDLRNLCLLQPQSWRQLNTASSKAGQAPHKLSTNLQHYSVISSLCSQPEVPHHWEEKRVSLRVSLTPLGLFTVRKYNLSMPSSSPQICSPHRQNGWFHSIFPPALSLEESWD